MILHTVCHVPYEIRPEIHPDNSEVLVRRQAKIDVLNPKIIKSDIASPQSQNEI